MIEPEPTHPMLHPATTAERHRAAEGIYATPTHRTRAAVVDPLGPVAAVTIAANSVLSYLEKHRGPS